MEKKLELKDITFDFIKQYCIDNNQVEWLVKKLEEKTVVERYSSRKAVTRTKTDKDTGEVKEYTAYIADKTSPKIKQEAPISFIEIRSAFVRKFMPELAPKKKAKESTMFDSLEELKALLK